MATGNPVKEARRRGISRRLSVIAVVVILAAAAYLVTTGRNPAGGTSGGSNGTGSQAVRPTSTVGTVSTVVEQKGAAGLRYYDWTSFENLTMTVFDNSSVPLVINAVSFTGSILGTGSLPKSLNVTANAGGCTPTGTSPPFRLPASCNPGEALTIYASPPAGISECSGPGVLLIVTLGQTQQRVYLDVRVDGSSANPAATPPQNCASSRPLLGYTAGDMPPNTRWDLSLAPLEGDRFVEINLSSSETLQMYLHSSSGIVYTVSGQSGIFTYCAPASGSYDLELYNPGPYVNPVFIYVYDLTKGACTPGG